MKESLPRLGVDLDGVAYQWDSSARFLLEEEFGYDPIPESKSWSFLEERVNPTHWQWLWNEGIQRGLFRFGRTYRGTVEAIHKLETVGEVVFITHRPRSARSDTLQWLGYQRFAPAEVHLLSNSEPKSGVKCDLYIDDKIENLIDLRTNTDAICLLWSRPWNFGWDMQGVERIDSWDQVLDAAVELRDDKVTV